MEAAIDKEKIEKELEKLDAAVKRDEYRLVVRKAVVLVAVIASLGWLIFWAIRGGIDLAAMMLGG